MEVPGWARTGRQPDRWDAGERRDLTEDRLHRFCRVDVRTRCGGPARSQARGGDSADGIDSAGQAAKTGLVVVDERAQRGGQPGGQMRSGSRRGGVLVPPEGRVDGVPGAEERHRQHRGCPLPELRCELPAAPAHGGGGADSRSVTGPAGARSGQRDRDAERRPPGGERPGSPGGFVGERAVVIGRRYRHGVSRDRWVHGGRDHSGPKVAGRRRRHRTGGQRQVEEHHRIARDRLVGIVPRRCRARRSVSAPVGLSLAPEGDRGDRNGPGTPAALVGRSWHASRRSGSSGRAEMTGRRPAVPR
jgi:hypothetical protein